jgi:hypothetical protein
VAGDLQPAAVQFAEPVGEEAEVLRDPRHHAAAMRAEQRAVVAGFHLRKVLDPPLDAVGDRMEDGGPVRRRGLRPAGERLARRPHRGRDLGLAAPGDLGQRLLVDGGEVGERTGRSHPAPTDPVPGVDRHAGHARFAHRHPARTNPVPSAAPVPSCARPARQRSRHRGDTQPTGSFGTKLYELAKMAVKTAARARCRRPR